MTDTRVLDAELVALNAEVVAALAKRKAWMDEHMKDYAKIQVGEEIYNLDSGQLLGVVSKHYRYWGGRDPQYDTSMDVEYEYLQSGSTNCYNNTSSQSGVSFGTRERAAKHALWRAESLSRSSSGAPFTWEEVFKARI